MVKTLHKYEINGIYRTKRRMHEVSNVVDEKRRRLFHSWYQVISAMAVGQEKGTYRTGQSSGSRPRHSKGDLMSQTSTRYALKNSTISSGDGSLDLVAKSCTESR